ncbi:hypothetical protein A1OO_08605 [Enterovibrio norvegicus FF-33]|uniref:hypothetical protein n=1 Tax=Enterovibrio norvegicus TaxID=188144 RepID=UPI0002F4A140|nr:hypothetical protein [Enterovibrio norvegicus]OEE65859.1 hypothetical protein A1OO_08605 [Enterovibrio norvegicus FF-33]
MRKGLFNTVSGPGDSQEVTELTQKVEQVDAEVGGLMGALAYQDSFFQSGYRDEDGVYKAIPQEKRLPKLQSIGSTFIDAKAFGQANPQILQDIARANQRAIEVALGTRHPDGTKVNDADLPHTFNVELPIGYFPIVGDLDLPPCVGRFYGLGSMLRRKGLYVGNTEALRNISEFGTCLFIVGDNNESGIRTQCSSSRVGYFTIHGGLKPEGSGGHGVIEGYTPPIAEATALSTLSDRAAALPNTFTQNRFGEPIVHRDLTAFSQAGNGDTHITVAVGSYNDQFPVVDDDSIDIPLVRYVRAYDSDRVEIARYAMSGTKLGGGHRFSFHDGDCTSRPARDEDGQVLASETRVYHQPFDPETDENTTIVVPGGLPADTVTVDVSLYHLVYHQTYTMLMFPFLHGKFSVAARQHANHFESITVESMPWNGWMLVDGFCNRHVGIICRYNQLDGFHAPAGYEDYMHNTFEACAGINNQGWGVYLREPFNTSHSNDNAWPDGEGRFIVHRKRTYSASLNDLGNFDTYGNRGGAFYFGADSNRLITGSAEHHYDAHNIDIFGTRSDKHLGDWNPLRWAGCIVFAALARQNEITMTSTPTDTRRVLFCRWRNPLQTVATTNPDSNIFAAESCNHYTHPRPDQIGSLVNVLAPSFANMMFTQYWEHDRLTEGNLNKGGSGFIDLLATWSKRDTLLFRPYLYSVSPKQNFDSSVLNVVFSSQDDDTDVAKAGRVTLSADQLGIAGQYATDNMYVGTVHWVATNDTIPVGSSKMVATFISEAGSGFDIANLDLSRPSLSISYVDDDQSKVAQGGIDYDQSLPDSLIIQTPRIARYQNANDDWVLRVQFELFNAGDSDFVGNGVNNERYRFAFRFETHCRNNTVLN